MTVLVALQDAACAKASETFEVLGIICAVTRVGYRGRGPVLLQNTGHLKSITLGDQPLLLLKLSVFAVWYYCLRLNSYSWVPEGIGVLC